MAIYLRTHALVTIKLTPNTCFRQSRALKRNEVRVLETPGRRACHCYLSHGIQSLSSAGGNRTQRATLNTRGGDNPDDQMSLLRLATSEKTSNRRESETKVKRNCERMSKKRSFTRQLRGKKL